MSRKFKLLNNAIVEEWVREDTQTNAGGYIDDYRVISRGDINEEDYESIKGSNMWICLYFNMPEKGLPNGGAWGGMYDIIEEITK